MNYSKIEVSYGYSYPSFGTEGIEIEVPGYFLAEIKKCIRDKDISGLNEFSCEIAGCYMHHFQAELQTAFNEKNAQYFKDMHYIDDEECEQIFAMSENEFYESEYNDIEFDGCCFFKLPYGFWTDGVDFWCASIEYDECDSLVKADEFFELIEKHRYNRLVELKARRTKIELNETEMCKFALKIAEDSELSLMNSVKLILEERTGMCHQLVHVVFEKGDGWNCVIKHGANDEDYVLAGKTVQWYIGDITAEPYNYC